MIFLENSIPTGVAERRTRPVDRDASRTASYAQTSETFRWDLSFQRG